MITVSLNNSQCLYQIIKFRVQKIFRMALNVTFSSLEFQILFESHKINHKKSHFVSYLCEIVHIQMFVPYINSVIQLSFKQIFQLS